MGHISVEAGKVFNKQYENFIGGEWVSPVNGDYFDNLTPVTGLSICRIARSTSQDIDLALDAAHKAKDKWARTSAAERANLLNKIADRMETILPSLLWLKRSIMESQYEISPRQTFLLPLITFGTLPDVFARKKEV